jgi:hypothetical protein
MEKKRRDKPKRKKRKTSFQKRRKNGESKQQNILSLSLVYISKSVASIWRVREKDE